MQHGRGGGQKGKEDTGNCQIGYSARKSQGGSRIQSFAKCTIKKRQVNLLPITGEGALTKAILVSRDKEKAGA